MSVSFEFFAAVIEGAFVRLFSGVNSFVNFQISFFVESFAASAADERLFSGVCADVDVEAATVAILFSAVGERTFVS